MYIWHSVSKLFSRTHILEHLTFSNDYRVYANFFSLPWVFYSLDVDNGTNNSRKNNLEFDTRLSKGKKGHWNFFSSIFFLKNLQEDNFFGRIIFGMSTVVFNWRQWLQVKEKGVSKIQFERFFRHYIALYGVIFQKYSSSQF